MPRCTHNQRHYAIKSLLPYNLTTRAIHGSADQLLVNDFPIPPTLRIRLTRIEALTEARQGLRNESNAYSALIYALQYADLN
jgi:hypothetical protein